jgi:hypothetical protein
VPTLELTVLVKQDGVAVPGFPWVRRIVVDDVQPFDYQLASGGGDTVVPTAAIASLHALLVRALNQPTTVKLPSIALAAGGIVVVLDGVLTTPTIANASGAPTEVQGLGGGT